MYLEEQAFTVAELQLISEILNNGDEPLRQGINNDIDRFAEVIRSNSKKRGIKWDDLGLIFEWTYERDNIREYIKTEKTVLKDYHKNAIENAFVN